MSARTLHAVATERPARIASGIAAASGGMAVFAWCSHQSLPWLAIAILGLALGVSAIASTPFGAATPANVLGLETFSARIAAFSAAGIGLGVGAGYLHRHALGIALQPVEGAESFVVVACLIGATEELLYRGWVLGRARAFGWPAAVVIAAVTHAAYKTALFAWPAGAAPVDLSAIALGTVAGGTVLGLLRVSSDSLIPPMLAHAAFDFVVYRSVAHAPWWVWS